MDTYRQLQVLVLVSLALLFAPKVLPPLRQYATTMRLVALVVYLVGAAVIFVIWQFKG